MSDDWEEDFEVPDFSAIPTNQKKAVEHEEEEDLTLREQREAAQSTSKPMTESSRKKIIEEELKLANKLKYAQLDSLTVEQKKAKEREMIEESDARLAGELFGSATPISQEESVSRGIASIPIKTKQDHVNFGLLCVAKVEDSTSFNTQAFYKEVTERLKDKLTVEGLNEIIQSLTVTLTEKKKTAASVNKTSKKSVKALKQEMMDLSDKYGGDYDYDDSHYSSIEDDFM